MSADASPNPNSTAIVVAAVVLLLVGGIAAVAAYWFLTPLRAPTAAEPPPKPESTASQPRGAEHEPERVAGQLPPTVVNPEIAAPEPPDARRGPEPAPKQGAEPLVEPPIAAAPVKPPPAKEDHGPAPAPPAATVTEPPAVVPPPKTEPAAVGVSLAAQTPLEVVDVKKDGSPLVRPVRAGSRTFERSLWAQPAGDRGSSQIGYRLQGKYVKLTGVAGVADGVGHGATTLDAARVPPPQPTAVFRVYGDGNLLWESKTLAGAGTTEGFEIAVVRVEVLALTCESESPSANSAFFWGDPRLTEK